MQDGLFLGRSVRGTGFRSTPARDCRLVVRATPRKASLARCVEGIISKAQSCTCVCVTRRPAQIKARPVDLASAVGGRAGLLLSRILPDLLVGSVVCFRRSGRCSILKVVSRLEQAVCIAKSYRRFYKPTQRTSRFFSKIHEVTALYIEITR